MYIYLHVKPCATLTNRLQWKAMAMMTMEMRMKPAATIPPMIAAARKKTSMKVWLARI